MLPSEIESAARNAIGALNDDKWSSSEVMRLIQLCANEMAIKTRCIKLKPTALTSVASTADYSLPTNTLEVIRCTYDANKLKLIDLRTYDSLVGATSVALTTTGTPQYYMVYGSTLTLYPTPGTSGDDIQLWTVATEALPTAASTLSTPAEYHPILVDGVSHRMLPKDTGDPRYEIYFQKWIDGLRYVEMMERRKIRGDAYTVVKREEDMINTWIGST